VMRLVNDRVHVSRHLSRWNGCHELLLNLKLKITSLAQSRGVNRLSAVISPVIRFLDSTVLLTSLAQPNTPRLKPCQGSSAGLRFQCGIALTISKHTAQNKHRVVSQNCNQ
jgi:hypothetical protein